MITPMTRFSFILLSGEEGKLLETLQGTGLVDITRGSRAVDKESQDLYAQAELVSGLIQGLGKMEIPEGTQPRAMDMDIVRLTGGVLERFALLQSDIKSLEKEKAAAAVWGTFQSEDLRKLSEAGLTLHFHSVPAKTFRTDWAQETALEVISSDKNTVYFVTVGRDHLPGEITAPTRSAAEVETALEEARKQTADILAVAAGCRERLPELKQIQHDTLSALDLKLANLAAVPAAENTIVTLEGYTPTDQADAVCATLDALDVFYLKEDAKAEDNPPIQFKNNWFVRQFEVLTDMYGRPAYDGFDPTPFISFFFLLFFAFCMGDCGYGLILIVIGLLLRKVESFKGLAPLVVILGAGTTLVGFLFHTFFSMDISTWKVFEPIRWIFLPGKIAGYDGTMVLSIIVGVVHLCLAMCVKTYESTKTKGFLNSLGTWGWTLLIVGGVAVGALALIGVLTSDIARIIIIALGIVSALGIFVFNDMHRNKLANVGVGLWDTYNTVTGLVGDVLSYLRLYALGLAGSMLGLAFNNIGNMILGDGSNALLWIPFILIVVIGHTLNIAMAALGAFVHPLRLNFLEFFKNSGYEARGRNFHPLSK